jgi:hypothetical protein
MASAKEMKTEENKMRRSRTNDRRIFAAYDRRVRRISEGRSIHKPRDWETEEIIENRRRLGLPIIAFAKRPWWKQSQHDANTVRIDEQFLAGI